MPVHAPAPKAVALRHFAAQAPHRVACAIVLGSAFFASSALAQDANPAAPLDVSEALRFSQSVTGTTPDDFTLLDRAGEPVRLSRYRGKPLLVSFIYTGCFQVCPLTTRSLQRAIDNGRDVFGTNQFNVISVGFNQPADSPQSLKSFARQHGIDAPNWEFLSPHPSIVGPLTRAFGFTYQATPAGFDHVLQVTLLDAQGRIYRQIYGEELSADAVGAPLKQLLRNAPVAQQLRLDDLIERVRILCTVYDPDTGKYRVNYGLLIEVAGGITFALAMVAFFAAEWRSRRQLRRAQRLGSPGALSSRSSPHEGSA